MMKTLNSGKIEKALPFLCFGFFALVIVGVPFDLLADNPFTKLIGKVDSIYDTAIAVAGIVAGGGVIIAGIKFVMGSPDALSWLWKSLLGAFIIFSAGTLIDWIST